jgi:hypothetical protein
LIALSGWRRAVDSFTKRPVIAERYPLTLLPTVWVTVVFG